MDALCVTVVCVVVYHYWRISCGSRQEQDKVNGRYHPATNVYVELCACDQPTFDVTYSDLEMLAEPNAWLQLRIDFDSNAIRRPFDCLTTSQ